MQQTRSATCMASFPKPPIRLCVRYGGSSECSIHPARSSGGEEAALSTALHACPAQVQLLDAKGLKRLILSFERRVRGRCHRALADKAPVACMHARGAGRAASRTIFSLLGTAEDGHALQRSSLAYGSSNSRPVARSEHHEGTLCGPAQYKENLEMRMKHGDDPQKFLASEVDLDEEVHRCGWTRFYDDASSCAARPQSHDIPPLKR